MKKYLIGGALALLAGLFVTSCTHDDALYSNIGSADQKKEEFSQAFKSAFGQIGSNQDWGFDRAPYSAEDLTPAAVRNATRGKAETRSCLNSGQSDMEYNGWKNYPDIISEAESLKVVTEFSKVRTTEKNTYAVTWNNYYVQHVHTGTAENTCVGSANDHCTVTPGNNMKDLYARNALGTDEQIYDLNNNTSGNRKVDLMYNMGSYTSTLSQFSYKNTKSDSRVYDYIILKIDGSYYVGFDLAGVGQWHTFYGDGIYNDWIIKITQAYKNDSEIEDLEESKAVEETERVPRTSYGDSEITYVFTQSDKIMDNGRIFCEDLGGNYQSNREDFDYNDVVFDAYIIQRSYIRTKKEVKHKYEYIEVVTKYKDGTSETTDYEGNVPPEYQDATHNPQNNYVKEDVPDVVDLGYRYDKDTKEGVAQSERWFAKVTLLAAGGTKPVTVLDKDVHSAFGVGEATMVNTVDDHTLTVTGRTSYNGLYTSRDAVRLTNDNPPTTYDDEDAKAGEEYKAQYLFEVDADSHIIDIPVKTRVSDSDATDLDADKGEAPHKIAMQAEVKSDIETFSAPWTSERCAIDLAFPGFAKSVALTTLSENAWTPNTDYTYKAAPTTALCNEIKGDEVVTQIGSSSVTQNQIFTHEGYDISAGLYISGKNILNLLKSGDRLRIQGTGGDDWLVILSDGNSSRLHADNSVNQGPWKGYVDIYMTDDLIAKLKANSDRAAMIISGSGVMVTAIYLMR